MPVGGADTPGFIHDVCSAVHPLGRGSPFFSQLPLAPHQLHWIEPEAQLAHPLDEGAAIVVRDLDATARRLGPDAGPYWNLLALAVHHWNFVIGELAGPLRIPLDSRRLLIAARFGLRAIQPVTILARRLKSGSRRYTTPENAAQQGELKRGSQCC